MLLLGCVHCRITVVSIIVVNDFIGGERGDFKVKFIYSLQKGWEGCGRVLG